MVTAPRAAPPVTAELDLDADIDQLVSQIGPAARLDLDADIDLDAIRADVEAGSTKRTRKPKAVPERELLDVSDQIGQLVEAPFAGLGAVAALLGFEDIADDMPLTAREAQQLAKAVKTTYARNPKVIEALQRSSGGISIAFLSMTCLKILAPRVAKIRDAISERQADNEPLRTVQHERGRGEGENVALSPAYGPVQHARLPDDESPNGGHGAESRPNDSRPGETGFGVPLNVGKIRPRRSAG